MVWEQNIAVIVMLTAVTDMGLVSSKYSNTDDIIYTCTTYANKNHVCAKYSNTDDVMYI